MRKFGFLICLASMICTFGAAQITVYPGDANATNRCNHVDILPIGLNYGLTGPMRNFASTSWTPQSANPWGGPAMVDPAHSDCNGDGVVDRFDATVVEQNFGLLNGGFLSSDTNSISQGNAPVLQLSLGPDSALVNGVVSFTLDVSLGTPGTPIDSIYGFAATIDYDPQIVDVASFSFLSGSWLLDSQAITLVRIDTTLGKIFVSAVNIDHSNRSGSGTIATIGIVMDDDIRIHSIWNLLLTPSYVLGTTTTAALVPIRPVGDTLVVITGRDEPIADKVTIAPNPCDGQVRLTANEAITDIALMDAQGRIIAKPMLSALNDETIDTQHLPQGCYLLEVRTSNGVLRRKLLVQH